MVGQEDLAEGQRSPSFLHSLKAALAAVSSALHTRLKLFVTELEEERERLKQAPLLTLLLFFCLSFGFILLTIFVVALFWEKGWIFATGGLAALYLAVGIAAAVMLRDATQKNTNPAGPFSCHYGRVRKGPRSPEGILL